MADAEPVLAIADAARQAASARLQHVARPFVAIGIGASEPSRQWGAAGFAALARGLRAAGWDSLVLLGGAAETALAAEIERLAGDTRLTSALGWRLDEVAALLAEATFYVGNNTGVMNMAAAVGIPTYALFGTTLVFEHSRHIIPIASPPDKAAGDDGMARIMPRRCWRRSPAGSGVPEWVDRSGGRARAGVVSVGVGTAASGCALFTSPSGRGRSASALRVRVAQRIKSFVPLAAPSPAASRRPLPEGEAKGARAVRR